MSRHSQQPSVRPCQVDRKCPSRGQTRGTVGFVLLFDDNVIPGPSMRTSRSHMYFLDCLCPEKAVRFTPRKVLSNVS